MKKNIILFSVFLLGLILFGVKTHASTIYENGTSTDYSLYGNRTYSAFALFENATISYANAWVGGFNNWDSHPENYGYLVLKDSNGVAVATSSQVHYGSNYPNGALTSFSFNNEFLRAGETYTPYLYVSWTAGTDPGSASYISLNGTGGVSNPVISTQFLYPQNSTSTYIHDFSYFTFKATNLSSDIHSFRFKVVYDTTSTFDNTPVSVSRNIDYAFAGSITHYLNIPKPGDLTSSTIYYAKLCSSVDGDIYWACDTPIAFQTGALSPGYHINTETAGFYGSTTTEAGIMYPTSTTDITAGSGLICGTEFYNPANWACWGAQRVYAIWNDLKDFAVGIFEQGWNGLKAVFPLNILSHFSEDLNAVSLSTSTIDSLTLTGQGSAFKHDNGYYSFTFLTSSTLKESENATGFDWESLVVYFLWAITGLFIVFSAIILIQKAGHSTKK